MSSAYFIRDGEHTLVYGEDQFAEALYEFLRAITEGGAESLRLEWSA